MTEHTYIPFHRPCIGQEEIDAVAQVLTSRWLTTGPVTIEFEKEFANYIGCKYALAVNSGTAANAEHSAGSFDRRNPGNWSSSYSRGATE